MKVTQAITFTTRCLRRILSATADGLSSRFMRSSRPNHSSAEGFANFGREVVFTKPERLAFEKEVLWPAAGIDPSRVAEFYEVRTW